MNSVADISVLEGLQAAANASMGNPQGVSQMAVFNDIGTLQRAYKTYVDIVKKGAEAEKRGEHGWLDSPEGKQYWTAQSNVEKAFNAEKKRLYDEFRKVYQREAENVEKEYAAKKKEILKSKAFDAVRKDFAEYNKMALQEQNRNFGIHGEMRIVGGLIPEPNETWSNL